MKLTTNEFNPKKLDVKVEPSKFKRYTGDIPRTGTVLIHRVTKLWWTQAEDGTSMIKLLAVAEQNTGDKKKFNGLPTWEYLVFKPDAAFRYVPFLQCFGITLFDIKNKMVVSDEPDSIGDVIESLGGWEVGSDDALCRIVILRKRWADDWQSRVDREGWLPLDEEDEVEDDDIEEDDDDEEEEAPARPARRSRSTQAPARGAKAASARSRRAEPEDEDDEDEDDEDIDDEDDDDLEDELDDEDEDAEEEDQEAEDEDQEEEEPPARTKRKASTAGARRTPARAASSTRAASSSRSRPAKDGSRTRSSRTPTTRARGSKEDPPF
jgi:hypothetical protein